uniref:Uncharacterized protein n=1 Tax=Kalanchoe fedtschenkoi TaxID=63787 RepID=A0A7N1A049_KALFE
MDRHHQPLALSDEDGDSSNVETETELIRLAEAGDGAGEQLLKSLLEANYELQVYKGKIKDVERALQQQLTLSSPHQQPQPDPKIDELGLCRQRIQELEGDRTSILDHASSSVHALRLCLSRIFQMLNAADHCCAEGQDPGRGVDAELSLTQQLTGLVHLASALESEVSEYQEMRKKETRQLESCVVSLTEENRDINTLLRIALVEKEAVEKSLNKLKGNAEQKRVPLLQFAERGLHKVGFSFMMASPQAEQLTDISNASSKSDGSDLEDDPVSLASVVENIMKNLRAEISQLRRSLDDARSDNERLQTLSEKRGQIIAENEVYIKNLEDREQMLSHNIEGLLIEMKETEEEVSRWREACELEVEAGKSAVDKLDKIVLILQQELEKTKAALETSNNKLKLKENLANAAMAAQAAAEKSLQLADSRAAGLRARIEELTRQLEETESRQRNTSRVRHVCWPWLALKLKPITTANGRRTQDTKWVLPDMQALLPG